MIVIVMLVMIGLSAAAAMRGATSSEQVANNLRLEALAQQYAEMGLQYCEAELAKASDARPLNLREDKLSLPWNESVSWSADRVTPLPKDLLGHAGPGSSSPLRPPECLAERLSLVGGRAYLVTVRGFSPGYRADGSGGTVAGSVVWLQSTVAFD